MLSVLLDGEHFQESSKQWIRLADRLSFWAGCCTTSVGSSAGRSFSRSGELLIRTVWFAVASLDKSDMLTISGCNRVVSAR